MTKKLTIPLEIRRKMASKKYRAKPESKAHKKEYNSRPENKVKRREYQQRPETKKLIKEYNKKPRVKEKKKQSDKKYREKNKERLNAWKKEWYKRNREKVKSKVVEYRKTHKELCRKTKRKYWDNKRFGGNREFVLQRDNWECQDCGMTNEQHILIFGYRLDVHHINGKEEDAIRENLISLCKRCHTKRHNREKI